MSNVDQAEIGKFDALASRWWDPEGDFRPLHDINPARLAFIEENADLQAGEVVDVGCGGGLFLGLAAETRALKSGLGFDANPATIAIAQNLALETDNVSFMHLDVEAPWPEGPFDVVSMIDVMHHIPPAAQPGIFPLVAARLKPGGVFLYKDINAGDWLRATANRMHDLALAQDWVHYLPTARARALAEEAGLTEERYAKINRLWYGHDLHVFRRPA